MHSGWPINDAFWLTNKWYTLVENKITFLMHSGLQINDAFWSTGKLMMHSAWKINDALWLKTNRDFACGLLKIISLIMIRLICCLLPSNDWANQNNSTLVPPGCAKLINIPVSHPSSLPLPSALQWCAVESKELRYRPKIRQQIYKTVHYLSDVFFGIFLSTVLAYPKEE